MERREFFRNSLAALLGLPTLFKNSFSISESDKLKSEMSGLLKETSSLIQYAYTEKTGPHNYRHRTNVHYINAERIWDVEIPLEKLYGARDRLVEIKKHKDDMSKRLGREFKSSTIIHIERDRAFRQDL